MAFGHGARAVRRVRGRLLRTPAGADEFRILKRLKNRLKILT